MKDIQKIVNYINEKWKYKELYLEWSFRDCRGYVYVTRPYKKLFDTIGMIDLRNIEKEMIMKGLI